MLSPNPKRSPTKKRLRPRDSPLLQPIASARKQPPRTKSRVSTRVFQLSREKRQRWLLEAIESSELTQLSQNLQTAVRDTIHYERAMDICMIDSPSLGTRQTIVLGKLTDVIVTDVSSNLSLNPAPTCFPSCASVPLYARKSENRSPVKPPRQLLRSISPSYQELRVSCLISQEMRAKLQAHLDCKIKGNHWQNEVRSRLARPLSASVFANREEQLQHPLVAKRYSSETHSETGDLYPYSFEAHDFTRRIGRVYRKHCYRRDVLIRVRRLAIAIRHFRHVLMPRLLQAYRRRRRAAVTIQQSLRRYLRWKRYVLRPFVHSYVVALTRCAFIRVKARVVVITKLRQLVRERQARKIHERQRRRVIFRWVAKTRVALFVHQRWILGWFQSKRETNLKALQFEVDQLIGSDEAVRREYSAIFTTAFGRKLLKTELSSWRQSMKRPREIESSSIQDEEGVDPSVVRLHRCFHIFDMDGSGTLDLDEFELMLSYLRASLSKSSTSTTVSAKRTKLTTAQVRDLFESLDVDGNGKVTRDEFEHWWINKQDRSEDGASGSASMSLLSTGIDRLVLTGHGLIFWLLGKKQQLERKFVKKLLIKKAQESAKRALITSWVVEEASAVKGDTERCLQCGRRFGLRRDLDDHRQHYCSVDRGKWVLDPFTWKRWVREEELRLLEEDADNSKASDFVGQEDGDEPM